MPRTHYSSVASSASCHYRGKKKYPSTVVLDQSSPSVEGDSSIAGGRDLSHKQHRNLPSVDIEPEPSSFGLRSGTAYIQDCVSSQLSNLYTLNLSTGKTTLIGAIATEVTDITFVGSQLYGLNYKDGSQTTQLIKVDPATGQATVIGDIGYQVIGLAYNHYGKALYASTAKQLIAIDINRCTGGPAVNVAKENYNCGEVAFDRNGKTYITLIGYDKRKFLATCDLYTSTVTMIGDIGFPNLGSMEFYGDTLYGVTGNFFGLGSDGQLIRIDTTTGTGTLVATTDPIGRWAGITVYEADKLSRS